MRETILLQTTRLRLRQFQDTPEDLNFLLNLDTDPEVRRFLDQPRSPTPESAKATLDRFLEWNVKGERYGFWVAVLQRTDEEIGWFHFRPSRPYAGEIELGYRLKRSAWGQGYATEGSRALIKRGLGEYGLDKVIATTLVENAASRRVMEKCGLTVEEEFLYDNRLPALKYAIWRSLESSQ